jgi:hypothetical protein
MPQALALIAALGIPAAAWQAARGPEEAVAASDALGYPVVLKLSAPSLVHKTEAGAVLLNLTDAAQVAAGFARCSQIARETLPPGEPWEVVVMSQAAGGREALLGARRDPSFGPVVAFGAGGIDTEVQEDVSLRVAPVSPAMARDLVGETRLGRILAGLRGQPAADLDRLAQALAALSRLMVQFPRSGSGLNRSAFSRPARPPGPGRPHPGGVRAGWGKGQGHLRKIAALPPNPLPHPHKGSGRRDLRPPLPLPIKRLRLARACTLRKP